MRDEALDTENPATLERLLILKDDSQAEFTKAKQAFNKVKAAKDNGIQHKNAIHAAANALAGPQVNCEELK